jgi:serpin B
MVQSKQQRVTSPAVEEAELSELVDGNSAFAFDVYQAVQAEDNLFYSPHSISLALAMTYAGAEGETARQMAETLHFTLPQECLHPTFNALDLALARRGEQAGESENGDERFQLNIVNAVWGQEGHSFLPGYLDVLSRNYGAGLRLLDFERSAEEARQAINRWVSEQTEERIDNLIPAGAIDPLTRLVLTNAIYFKAAWQYPFEEDQTQEQTFYPLGGGEITVPMMNQTQQFRYAEGEGYQAVELLYVGNTASMVILLPRAEAFKSFESSLDADRVEAVVEDLEPRSVILTMPRFEFASRLRLADTLADLGMPNAFSPEDADFSGMDGTRNLYIQDVLHKAFVSVDEAGTEAAAATAVVVGVTSAPSEPVEVTVDRPFVFLIRDLETGAILFVGRVVAPGT